MLKNHLTNINFNHDKTSQKTKNRKKLPELDKEHLQKKTQLIPY